MEKINLLKLGRSETKRADIKSSYENLVSVLRSIDLDKINLEKDKNHKNNLLNLELYNALKESQFFTKKTQSNSKREISLAKSDLYLLNSDKEGNFHLTDVGSKWGLSSYDKESLHWFNLSSNEYSLFQSLIKMNVSGKYALKEIYNNHIIHKKELKYSLISYKNINEIRDKILKKDSKYIGHLIKNHSGSGDKKYLMLKVKAIDLFVSYLDMYWDNQLTIDKLNTIEDEAKSLFEEMNKVNSNSPVNYILSLFFPEITKTHNVEIKLTWANIIKGTVDFDLKLEPTNEFIYKKIEARLILGSYGSYKHLIISHLRMLPELFKIGNNNFKIQDKANKLISQILSSNNIYKLVNTKFYSPIELLKILEIDLDETCRIISSSSIKKIYNKHYNWDSSNKKILDYFPLQFERSKYQEIINDHEHIKGRADIPTFYEFIVGMIFLIKENKDLFNLSESDFKLKIRNHFNTRINFTSDFCPERFASGGKSDIILSNNFDKNVILIEPSTQLYRQSKMEFTSISDHLKKYELSICAIAVFPVIESEFKENIYNRNTSDKYIKKNIYSLSNKEVLNYFYNTKSIYEVIELKKISKDF